MEVKVVIPSHKRAARVRTKDAVANCILCVPESQLKEYKQNNPNIEIVTHPDTVRGLAAKRNWIYRKFGNVMMLDDDIQAMQRLYIPPYSLLPTVIEPALAYDIIQVTANMAKELGAYLFGFGTVSDARCFKPYRPFRLTGYCNGCAFGLLKGSNIFFHEEAIAVEDYFGSLINAFYHRYAFFDTRFGMVQLATFKNIGGQAEFRNQETERNDFLFLKRMFGSIVRGRGFSHFSKPSHEYQRSIKLPF
jgi:hypothetical protein